MRTKSSAIAAARDAVIAAWHGAMIRDEIARRHGMSCSTITAIWCAARRDGRLPAAARPHFAGLTGGNVLGPDRDAKPIVPGRDHLLIRLRQVHGADPRRAFDTLTLDLRTDRVRREKAIA